MKVDTTKLAFYSESVREEPTFFLMFPLGDGTCRINSTYPLEKGNDELRTTQYEAMKQKAIAHGRTLVGSRNFYIKHLKRMERK